MSYGQNPIKRVELTTGAYALAVSVQKAHTHLVCRGCDTKMVEGEPMIALHLFGDYKLNWRRNYCGACSGKWVAQTIEKLKEADLAMQDEIAKLGGDGYYVGKRMAGDTLKARKGMKKVLDDLVNPGAGL